MMFTTEELMLIKELLEKSSVPIPRAMLAGVLYTKVVTELKQKPKEESNG